MLLIGLKLEDGLQNEALDDDFKMVGMLIGGLIVGNRRIKSRKRLKSNTRQTGRLSNLRYNRS